MASDESSSNESYGLSIAVLSDGVLSVDVRAAAIRGAIEILINPEYGTDWIINEVLRDVPDEEVTEEVAEQVDALIMSRFKGFAASLAEELPVETARVWNT